MFTGIVQEAGMVKAVTPRGKGWSLEVEAGVVALKAKIGDSIAVNGCCLTVTEVKGNRLTFDLLDETRAKTNLKAVQAGSRVNLEESLRAEKKIYLIRDLSTGSGTQPYFIYRSGDLWYYRNLQTGEGFKTLWVK